MGRPARSAYEVTALDGYAQRGRECAYGNLRLIARVVGTVYEDALRPAQLRPGQLSLMWAIAATEPVEIGRLASITLTDQTTLSRTVEKLRKARLVSVRPGIDARRKVLRLSPLGRRRFAAAMPYWEEAQRRVARLLSVREMRALAVTVRDAARRSDEGSMKGI